MQLLLVSSSRTHGTEFLEHCSAAMREHFQGLERIVFIPFALADHDGYASLVHTTFESWGIAVDSLHEASDQQLAIRNADGVFVGGGNTFRLLNTLYEHRLMEVLANRVREGMPYAGSSAGTNITAPTIRTTNDMPIVEPPSFDALSLVPFQINPHYLDADPKSQHQGETRETRLKEYLEENEIPVAAIREGSWLRIRDSTCRLEGSTSMRWFARDCEPQEFDPGFQFEIETGPFAE